VLGGKTSGLDHVHQFIDGHDTVPGCAAGAGALDGILADIKVATIWPVTSAHGLETAWAQGHSRGNRNTQPTAWSRRYWL